MSKKVKYIEKLTDEQIALQPAHVEYWIGIGLQTGASDIPRFKRGMSAAYAFAGYKWHNNLVMVKNPLIGSFVAPVADFFFLHGRPKNWQEKVSSILPGKLCTDILSAVAALTDGRVKSAKAIDLKELGTHIKDNFSMWHGGQFWVGGYWYGNAAVRYLIDVCNLDLDEDKLARAAAYDDINMSSCYSWPFKDFIVVSERPTVIKRDDEGRLHCSDGPALAFDGMEIYSWHGVTVPAEWLSGKKPTPKEALTWENVEQRRAACEIVGWDKVLEDASLNPKVIDEDEPHIGTLIQVDLPDAPEQWFIKYRCGTGRWFAEAVNDKTFNTALKANAGGNGWRPGAGDPEQYIPLVRT